MTAATNTERQAASRARLAAEGLVRRDVWVHPDDIERLTTYLERLRKGRQKTGGRAVQPPTPQQLYVLAIAHRRGPMHPHTGMHNACLSALIPKGLVTRHGARHFGLTDAGIQAAEAYIADQANQGMVGA